VIAAAQLAQVLIRAAALVEAGWCQEHEAVDATGHAVSPLSPSAVRWSQMGAIHRATVDQLGQDLGPAIFFEVVRMARQAVVGSIGTPSLTRWNSAPGRTVFEVAETLRRVAAQLEA
jgi:hypothetical protein